MPFVKKKFYIENDTVAFLYVMHTLNFSQAQAQRHIAKGRLLVNGEPMMHTGAKIKDEVEMIFFQPKSKGICPVFQNCDFMVFEKPSGILVHPNTMSTPYSMLDEIRDRAGDNANAVHRIDMETSGLLMASKHKKAEHALKNSFEKRVIKKTYLAWVDGKLSKPFTSKEPISINTRGYEKTKHKVSISENGKASHTEFVPIEYDKKLDASLVVCYPHTGRLHQIRIHLFHVKHPILGDPIYGASFAASDDYLEMTQTPQERLIHHGASRLMLHAHSLEFVYKNRFYIESKEDFSSMRNLIHPKTLRVFNK